MLALKCYKIPFFTFSKTAINHLHDRNDAVLFRGFYDSVFWFWLKDLKFLCGRQLGERFANAVLIPKGDRGNVVAQGSKITIVVPAQILYGDP